MEAELLDRAITFCAKCGAAYWERADALCRSCWRAHFTAPQIESGLFPGGRYPGWTVEDALPGRGHDTDGAVGIVRGGVGSNRSGADHTQKATCCPAGGSAQTLGTHLGGCQDGGTLPPWDQGRPGLLAACGLNDQLVAKLAVKAEGSLARKTD